MSGPTTRAVTVLRPGPLALVVDLGRPGYAHLGVPPAGALDEPALRLANRLVGNPEPTAGLELVMGGAELRAETSCELAVTGPPVRVTVSGPPEHPATAVWLQTGTDSAAKPQFGSKRPDWGAAGGGAGNVPGNVRWVGSHRVVHLERGETLAVAAPGSGLRTYLAVSGGIDVPPVLGSCSADLLSGLGPPPLRAGQRLPLGRAVGSLPEAGVAPASAVPSDASVAVLLGPRDEWFSDPAGVLRAGRWEVSPASNRIGLRLAGPAVTRRAAYRDTELPSEPVLTGSIQVPPDGQPMIFLADHPTTGGYPVLGVVLTEHLPVLAQARPGTTLRLWPVRSAGP